MANCYGCRHNKVCTIDKKRFYSVIDRFCVNFEHQLTADVVEVKHGKWVVTSEEDGACYVKCSECGLETWYPIPDKSMLHNYCGDCGAKMDLEEK